MSRTRSDRAPRRTPTSQAQLPFPPGRGGRRRPGLDEHGRRKRIGRPPGPNPGIRHAKRVPVARSHPVFITVRLNKKLPRLRNTAERKVLETAFRKGSNRFGFRLTQYSIQNDHIHFVAEADGRRSVSRGMQGLLVRVAKALNRLWARKGSVFADRYHDRVLKTPREVRHALSYVLNNWRKHLPGRRSRRGIGDGFSSAPWFDGWNPKESADGDATPWPRGPDTPVVPPGTWLQKKGWRKHRLISPDEVPGEPRRAR